LDGEYVVSVGGALMVVGRRGAVAAPDRPYDNRCVPRWVCGGHPVCETLNIDGGQIA